MGVYTAFPIMWASPEQVARLGEMIATDAVDAVGVMMFGIRAQSVTPACTGPRWPLSLMATAGEIAINA